MSASNRSAIFGKMHKVLRKHYEPAAPPSSRPVLEHLLYASVLTNAKHDTVDEVFARLQKNFFDWNEIRVTSVPELAEGMSSIPDAIDAAKRLKRALQSVFETHYMFDLEFLRKAGLGKAVESIEKFSGVTPYVVAYMTQNALGGHAIPVNAAGLELLVILGAITEADAAKHRVPGLERAIPKNKGVEFASLLQQFSVDFAANPQATKIKGIVGEIDPSAKDRLPKKSKAAESPREPEPPRRVAPPKQAEARPEKTEKSDKGEKDRGDKADKDKRTESKKPIKPEPVEAKAKTAAARITRRKPK